MRRPRIAIACYGAPGRGGASTSSYQLFRHMQRQGEEVHYVALVDEKLADEYRSQLGDDFANPLGLDDVHCVTLRRPLKSFQAEASERLAAIAPDVVLAVSHLATITVKKAAPGLPTVFLTSGSAQVGAFLEAHPEQDATSVTKRLQDGGAIPLLHSHERRAVECADRIVAHSPMIHSFTERLYPGQREKLHEQVVSYAEWIDERAGEWQAKARPFAQRDVDILFVASNWARPVKNRDMACAIAAALPERRIHALGLAKQPIPGVRHHGLLPGGGQVFEWFGRARTVVCPSRLDAEPSVLIEAAALGANAVASANCGNLDLCAEPLRVAEPRDPQAWVRAIERGVREPHEHHLKRFLEQRGYDRLIAILEESAAPSRSLPRNLGLPGRLGAALRADGFVVLRGFLSSDEADGYREECALVLSKARVIHSRINRADMFDYVQPRHIAADGKVWSTRDPRRPANLARLYQFPGNRHSPGTREIFERVLSLRNGIEALWIDDENYRRERELLRDYVQVSHLPEGNQGVPRHRDAKEDLPYPQLQPFLLLSNPEDDFEGGELVLHAPCGRVRLQADQRIRKGDLVLFDRRLEHEVEPTTGRGRSGLGRWSAVIGARDVTRGSYWDRYRWSDPFVRHVDPLRKLTRRLARRATRQIARRARSAGRRLRGR